MPNTYQSSRLTSNVLLVLLLLMSRSSGRGAYISHKTMMKRPRCKGCQLSTRLSYRSRCIINRLENDKGLWMHPGQKQSLIVRFTGYGDGSTEENTYSQTPLNTMRQLQIGIGLGLPQNLRLLPALVRTRSPNLRFCRTENWTDDSVLPHMPNFELDLWFSSGQVAFEPWLH
ncbi:hypothetical protein BYT27DRAFT_6664238 [Phlegmacium glaucopus]|nr:hypothetical protein BYT27DRAFT_6664238 [Phlegmacium glaucopus]